MKKNTSNTPKNLTESEREELIRLRTENEYIKAENEVIKKEIALREKNYAAQLKEKKQRLSKNLDWRTRKRQTMPTLVLIAKPRTVREFPLTQPLKLCENYKLKTSSKKC